MLCAPLVVLKRFQDEVGIHLHWIDEQHCQRKPCNGSIEIAGLLVFGKRGSTALEAGLVHNCQVCQTRDYEPGPLIVFVHEGAAESSYKHDKSCRD